ncbi:MAG: GMC family oxidoreductase [Pseudomonadota bacterium]
MRFISADNAASSWDTIIVGSGFGSLFFLQKHLQKRPNDRILLLEWGDHKTIAEQRNARQNSEIKSGSTFINDGGKEWSFTIGLGGGTNCWWALSPRLHPSDFQINAKYGVNVDWPISYEELAPYYLEAEDTMNMAGPNDIAAVYPGADQYPLPPHKLSTVDRILKDANPDKHFAIPCARLSRARDNRGRCCSTGTCNLCPTGAKFYALNSMEETLSNRNVSICTRAKVEYLEHSGNTIEKVRYSHDGKEFTATADLVVLGANAIFNPFIMLRSGIEGAGLGRYLGEKIYAYAEARLDGIKHFDGGTFTTGLNTTLLDGAHRSKHGGAAILIENGFERFGLRSDPKRWRELLPIGLYIEDIFQETNGIFDDGGDKPIVRFKGFSDYAHNGLKETVRQLPEILSALPIEEIEFKTIHPTIAHLQGTTRFGDDPSTSVLDANQLHHKIRNLVVVGTSVFPTTGSANVSVTAAAMSLRAADKILS